MGAYITLLVVCFLVIMPIIFMQIDVDSRNRNGKN